MPSSRSRFALASPPWRSSPRAQRGRCQQLVRSSAPPQHTWGRGRSLLRPIRRRSRERIFVKTTRPRHRRTAEQRAHACGSGRCGAPFVVVVRLSPLRVLTRRKYRASWPSTRSSNGVHVYYDRVMTGQPLAGTASHGEVPRGRGAERLCCRPCASKLSGASQARRARVGLAVAVHHGVQGRVAAARASPLCRNVPSLVREAEALRGPTRRRVQRIALPLHAPIAGREGPGDHRVGAHGRRARAREPRPNHRWPSSMEPCAGAIRRKLASRRVRARLHRERRRRGDHGTRSPRPSSARSRARL